MTEARIEHIVGRRVWDSRGRPTVEAEIVLDNGASGRAIAPAGASTGTHEAVELRDGGRSLAGPESIARLRTSMARLRRRLRSMPIADQRAIDRRLIELDGTPNKARLGGNATIAVSMAAMHAAAAARRRASVARCGRGVQVSLPMPMIQIFGGGAHAGRRVDIQDFLIMPIGAALVRRGSGNGGARLPRGRRDHGGLAAGCAASPMRVGGGRSSPRMRTRSIRWSRRSSAPALGRGGGGRHRDRCRGLAILPRRPVSPRRGRGRARNRRTDRAACRMVPALPDRVGRGSSRRGRRARHGRVHRQSGRPGFRSSATTISSLRRSGSRRRPLAVRAMPSC